jgi:vacuolar-type H+-ATPase subunit E/Vma4
VSDNRNVDALRASMQAENERRRAEISSAADERIEQVRRKTESTIENERERAMSDLEHELGVTRRRLRDDTDRKARLHLLDMENAIIEETFREAAEKLSAPERNETYRPRLAALAAHAARAASNRASTGASIVVRVPAEIEGATRSAVEAVLNVDATAGRAGTGIGTPETSVEPSGESGTIVAATSDGVRIVDNGITKRLDRSRLRLQPRLKQVLFAESDDGNG